MAPAISPWGTLILAALVILIATLTPGSVPNAAGPICVLCGKRPLADATLNLILFMPLGAALARLRCGWKLALVVAVVGSSAIEFAQVFIPGRDSSLGDVLFNTLGAVVGYASFRALVRVRHAPPSRRRWLPLVGAAGALAGWTASAILTQPALTRSAYFGQWTPDFPGLERYSGQVEEARIGQAALPSRRFTDSESVRAGLLSGETLTVRATRGLPTTGLAPIFSVADDEQRRIFLLGADGSRIVFWYRMRASQIGLDQPDLRRELGSGSAASITALQLEVRRAPQGFCISVDGSWECRLGPSLAAGWSLLLHVDRAAQSGRALLGVLWTALLILPFGLTARRDAPSLVGLCLLLAGLVGLPLIGRINPSGWVEYAGLFIGLVGGFVAGRWFFRPEVGRDRPNR